MKLDFTKFTDVGKGSMTPAKAILYFHPPKGKVVVKDLNSGQNAETAGLLENAAGLGTAAGQMEMQKDRNEVFLQFNPAALRINAKGSGMPPIIKYGSKKGDKAGGEERKSSSQLDYGPIRENVTMSFKVIFDALRNHRAFLTDAVNMSPTNSVRQGVDLVRSESYTVRPVVEGFLATVRNSSMRRVDFEWGDMRYAGYLSKTECRYTMFDIEGEAVRAEVDLTLLCSGFGDNINKQELQKCYLESMKNWDSLFSLTDRARSSAFGEAVGIGKVEKACILLRKELFGAGEPGGAGKRITEQMDGLTKMAAAISGKTNQTDWGKEDFTKNNQTLALGRKEFVPVRVYYNPTSVNIYSRNGEKTIQEYGPADGWLQRNAIPEETVLTMELIFDETNNIDAFLLDSGMSSPTGLVKGGRHLASKMDGRKYSVALISELFVKATMSAGDRHVCFSWNKMVFWGELCDVDLEYTMFNSRGNPVRSKISIGIRQSGEASQRGDFEEIWMRAYDKLPKESEKLAKDKSLTVSAGNHIASNLFRM